MGHHEALEIVFDCEGDEHSRVTEVLNYYELGNQLGDVLQNSTSAKEAADILLAGCLVGLKGEIDVARAVLVEKGPEHALGGKTLGVRELLATDVLDEWREYLSLSHGDASGLRGLAVARAIDSDGEHVLSDYLEPDEVPLLPGRPWMPARLGLRRMCVIVADIAANVDCMLILDNSNQNDLLFDTALANMALLISPCRRVFALRERELQHQTAYANLQQKVDMFEEGDKDLLSLIPFVFNDPLKG